MIVRNFLFAVAVAVVLHCAPSGVLAQSLYTLPDGIETRWASAENPLGKRGEGAQTNGGRVGRPGIPVKAGQQITVGGGPGSRGAVLREFAKIPERRPGHLP